MTLGEWLATVEGTTWSPENTAVVLEHLREVEETYQDVERLALLVIERERGDQVMNISDLHSVIARHLDELKECFVTPTKITIVIRTPELENGGIVLSDESEDLELAVQEIRRLQASEKSGASSMTPAEAGEIHVLGSRRRTYS